MRAPACAGRFAARRVFDVGAGLLKHLARNCTPAGQAVSQARQPRQKYISSPKARVDLELAVGDGAHQRDAAARAVALELGGVVGRAGGQAHPAVHALLEHRVIEVLKIF